MTTYILRRLLFMIPTLIGITFLVFMLVSLAPGGIGAAIQAQAGGGGNFQASSGVAVQAAYLEDRYGLQDPKVLQYLRWLGRISPIKFGGLEQVLPSGEVFREPKAIPEPPLWRWFVDALPTVPQPEPVRIDASESEADRLKRFRALERAYIEARFGAVAATTMLNGQLVAYARSSGMPEAVDTRLRPRLDMLERAGPKKDDREWARVEELGRAAVEASAKARVAHGAFKAFFDARPFRNFGVPIIPGTVGIGWPDFGVAFSNSRPVIEQIAEALPVTIMLNVVAVPIIYLVAVPSGILAAVRKGSWFDFGLGSFYIMLYSFPVVLAGVLCVGFLANRDFLGWFPVANISSQEASAYRFLPAWTETGFERGWLLDRLWHICLPVMCLVYTGFAVLSKQTRAAMLENFSADYVRTAKAKGVPGQAVVFRHVFRNSLIPLITIFVTVFPAMLAGSVVVEKIFSIPGMGSLLLQAAYNRDLELILANTVMIAVVNLLALLAADILYAVADPRVAYD